MVFQLSLELKFDAKLIYFGPIVAFSSSGGQCRVHKGNDPVCLRLSDPIITIRQKRSTVNLRPNKIPSIATEGGDKAK